MDVQQFFVPVIPDGNCLFRCLSYFLFSTQECHNIVRLIIVKFVKDHWDHFKEFVSDEVYDKQISNDEDYYYHLSRRKTYGGQVEISAFLQIFPNIKIVIHQHNKPSVIHGNTTSNFQLILKLSGINDSGHYDIIQCYNENYKEANIEDLKKSALAAKKRFNLDRRRHYFGTEKRRKYLKEYMAKYRKKLKQELHSQSVVEASDISKTKIKKTTKPCKQSSTSNEQETQDLDISNKVKKNINAENSQNSLEVIQKSNETVIAPANEKIDITEIQLKRNRCCIEWLRKKKVGRKTRRSKHDCENCDLDECYNESYKSRNIKKRKKADIKVKKHVVSEKTEEYLKEYMKVCKMKVKQERQNIQSNVEGDDVSKTKIIEREMSCQKIQSNNEQERQDFHINNKERENIYPESSQNLQQVDQRLNETVIVPDTEEIDINETQLKRNRYMREWIRKKRAAQKKLSGEHDCEYCDQNECYNEFYKSRNIKKRKKSSLMVKKRVVSEKRKEYLKEYMKEYNKKLREKRQNIRSNVEGDDVSKTKIPCNGEERRYIDINNKERENINPVNKNNLQQIVRRSNGNENLINQNKKYGNYRPENIVDSFTIEWKDTQKRLSETMRQIDNEYLVTMEKIIEQNLNAMKKVLEDDRRETDKIFQKFLRTFHTNSNNSFLSLGLDSAQHNIRILTPSTIKEEKNIENEEFQSSPY